MNNHKGGESVLKFIEGQTAEEMIHNWTIEDLREFAAKAKIRRRSYMNKAQLAMALEDHMKRTDIRRPKTRVESKQEREWNELWKMDVKY